MSCGQPLSCSGLWSQARRGSWVEGRIGSYCCALHLLFYGPLAFLLSPTASLFPFLVFLRLILNARSPLRVSGGPATRPAAWLSSAPRTVRRLLGRNSKLPTCSVFAPARLATPGLCSPPPPRSSPRQDLPAGLRVTSPVMCDCLPSLPGRPPCLSASAACHTGGHRTRERSAAAIGGTRPLVNAPGWLCHSPSFASFDLSILVLVTETTHGDALVMSQQSV